MRSPAIFPSGRLENDTLIRYRSRGACFVRLPWITQVISYTRSPYLGGSNRASGLVVPRLVGDSDCPDSVLFPNSTPGPNRPVVRLSLEKRWSPCAWKAGRRSLNANSARPFPPAKIVAETSQSRVEEHFHLDVVGVRSGC